MTDGALPDRMAQLRSRWEADPASRVFLQLAEEYRHLGRLHEALGVLDQGLREHPGYLSALVAKGRCLLELGQPEPAREVLERVVRQDATQMVANKLLVRAYLETGQAARASERLDLYSLLHDGDPEIGDLRSRIDRLDGPSAPSSSDDAPPPTIMANMDPLPSEDDVFDLGAAALAAPHREVQDVFDLPLPSAPAAAAPIEAEPAALAAPPPDDDEPEAVADGEPFPGLVSRSVRRRYHAGLAAEGIFLVAPPPAPPPPAAPERVAADLEPAPEPWPSEAPFELVPLAPLAQDAEHVEAAPPPPPVSAPPAAEPEPATATLGDLYLRQGHAGEAERIFREVLRREPDNAAAQAGLARAAVQAPPAASAVPIDGRARKVQLLNDYLDRIRRGSGRHVS
jgi:tetratricopeptide (TPR) repeat protein